MNNPERISQLDKESKPYVIFGFTGQGQQTPEMFEPWYGFSEPTDGLLEHFHKITETDFGKPLDQEYLSQGPLMQPANTALQVIVFTALKQMGVTPNEVHGHSLGEVASIACAGAIAPEDAISLSQKRGESTDKNIRMLLKDNEARRGMAAISRKAGNLVEDIDSLTDIELRETLLGLVSNFNNRSQLVLSGPMDTIRQSLDKLKNSITGIRSVELAVDGAYHSVHMALAKKYFQQYVDQLAIKQPGRPKIYSPTTVGELRTRDEIASMLVNQLTEPVRYSELIQKRLEYLQSSRVAKILGRKGVKQVLFVEIGAFGVPQNSKKGVLIGINRDNISLHHGMPVNFHRVSIPDNLRIT